MGWLIVAGWALGMILASRWLVNWMGVADDWDDDPMLNVMMVFTMFMITLAAWVPILAFVALRGLCRLLPWPELSAKWVKAFYTLDREERKKILHD